MKGRLSMYTDIVMDHFKNPRNVGELKDANGIGQAGGASCGDLMRLYIRVDDNVVQDARFLIYGCGSAVAAGSMSTELIKGKTVEEALNITNKTVADALGGLPANKMHCSVLAEEVIRKAIEDYRAKTNN
jgi:nitrogen fixation NifU-like protein